MDPCQTIFHEPLPLGFRLPWRSRRRHRRHSGGAFRLRLSQSQTEAGNEGEEGNSHHFLFLSFVLVLEVDAPGYQEWINCELILSRISDSIYLGSV